MLTSRWLSIVLLAAAASCAPNLARAQSTDISDLGVGKLLVSSRELGDPSFAETVVLLIQYDRQGTVGLMINRRTKLPISKILQDMNTAKHGSDPIYVGGPVELDAVLALMKSDKKPDDATSVLRDVYVVSSKEPLEKALAASSDSAELHVYLGYCGWDKGQLENEVRLGGWWIFEASAKAVFDPNPDSVWTRFIERTEQQIAEVEPSQLLGCTLPACVGK